MRRDHGFDNEQLEGWLSQAESKPGIIELISRPAEKVKPWHEYRQIFLTGERIRRGQEFYRNNLAAILSAAETSGVEAEIIAAIIGVETYYGDRPGKNRIIDALSTLAFDYPPRQKFFRRELAKFFELARAQGIDPLTHFGIQVHPQAFAFQVRPAAVGQTNDQPQFAIARVAPQNLKQLLQPALGVLLFADADGNSPGESSVEIFQRDQFADDQIRPVTARAAIDRSARDQRGVALKQVALLGEPVRPQDAAHRARHV
ncbi:MAG: lytic murein transglycosylase, partial [Proteobacteria bacterium]|nr:lytic murein transglycosylase [Pseudomonadota bacterium]